MNKTLTHPIGLIHA